MLRNDVLEMNGRNSSKLWKKLTRNLPALRFGYNVCNMMLSQESVAGESMTNCGQWHLEREIGHGAYVRRFPPQT